MKRVLLALSDTHARTQLAAMLRTRGAEPVEVDTALAAEQALSRAVFDAVTVDGMLAEGDALRIVERVRSDYASLPVVYLSAPSEDLDTLGYVTRELSVARVVPTPFNASELVTLVLSLLEPPVDTRSQQTALDLDRLRKDFTQALPAKLTTLEEVLALAPKDDTAYGTARGLAHRLRGSAGAYGHAALSRAMARLEDMLRSDPPAFEPARSEFFREAEESLRAARASVQRDITNPRFDDPNPSQSQKALLVVDDDPVFLSIARQVGRRLLLPVVTAQTAQQALERAAMMPLLAAVLDVHLDDQRSFDLARELRNTSGNAEIPIAFASGDHSIETRVCAIEAGAVKFFEKPMTQDSFSSLAQQLATISAQTDGHVLVVDDDTDALEHFAIHLRAAGIRVETQPSAENVVETLEQLRPDMLLLDLELPRVSGLDVCRALRMSTRFELLPILIVTAHTDDATRLKAFRAGASDVIPKPVLVEELLARVNVQLDRVRLLRDRADKDPLSGLLMRRALLDALQRAFAMAVRDEKPLSVVLFDLDHFKHVNDRYGHLAGDQVIARLGELLRRRFRVEDLRGRWGGEEFVLAFPGQGADFAERATQRILAEFSGLELVADDGTPFTATFTAGIASYPDDGPSIAALMRAADERLYAGKRQGRNRVTRAVALETA